MRDSTIREKMEKLLKKELRFLALRTRAELNLTQNKMGERYAMSGDSFSSIETGEYMCGSLTAILLLNDQRDPAKVLREIVEKLEKIREEEFLWI